MRKLDEKAEYERLIAKTYRFILGASLLWVAFGIGVFFWTDAKEREQKQNTCECKCFDAGYESALMDIQIFSDSEAKVKRSREDY